MPFESYWRVEISCCSFGAEKVRLYRRKSLTFEKLAAETPDPHENAPETIPQTPFEVESLMEDPDEVTVYPVSRIVSPAIAELGQRRNKVKFRHSPAQVAPTIHLPVEMRHPFVEDPEMTFTKTFPAGAVEVEPGAEVVEVEEPPPEVLGRYLIPVLHVRRLTRPWIVLVKAGEAHEGQDLCSKSKSARPNRQRRSTTNLLTTRRYRRG